MKKYTLFSFCMLLSVICIGQGHFIVAGSGKAENFMNFTVVTATIGAVDLNADDEIAVFDGNICCGKVILTQPIVFLTESTYADIVASEGQLELADGYIPGDQITYKFWDSSASVELSGITPEYLDPFGNPIAAPTFSNGGSAIVNLSYIKFLNIKVLLEGPYNGIGGMVTTLNSNNLIPLTSEIAYSSAQYGYTPSAVTSIPNAGIIDWVLVELRDAVTPETALPSTKLSGWPKAYFLKSDGFIVDLDGTSLLNIGNPTVTNNLYVIVRHRNHIDIMSANGATLNNVTYSYDFTDALTKVYGGARGYKQVGSMFAMVGGDIDKDGSIYVSDYNSWAVSFGQINGYYPADINFDGACYVSDYNSWAVNFGTTNPITKSANLINGAVNPAIIYTSQVPK